LFFAVELPSEAQAALGRLRPSAIWAADYRWVDPSMLHVTLAFLGEQPAAALESLHQAAAAAAKASRPGALSTGAAGSFGPARAPRVLWVGFHGDLTPLLEAQARLSDELLKAHFALEDRAFRAHITLARRRASASGAPVSWPPATSPPRLSFPMQRLTLFESRLGPAGARYTPVDHFPLKPARE
jgi:2'-5' RNA ligase